MSNFLTGAGFHVNDVQSTEFQMVDTWPKLFNLQKELIICSENEDSENGGYGFWSFTAEWIQFTTDMKREKYDKFASHEMNIFLYFKGNNLLYSFNFSITFNYMFICVCFKMFLKMKTS